MVIAEHDLAVAGVEHVLFRRRQGLPLRRRPERRQEGWVSSMHSPEVCAFTTELKIVLGRICKNEKEHRACVPANTGPIGSPVPAQAARAPRRPSCVRNECRTSASSISRRDQETAVHVEQFDRIARELGLPEAVVAAAQHRLRMPAVVLLQHPHLAADRVEIGIRLVELVIAHQQRQPAEEEEDRNASFISSRSPAVETAGQTIPDALE